MHALVELVLDLQEFCAHALAHGLTPNDELALSRLCARVREAEKVERAGFFPLPVPPVAIRLATERNQPRLLRVQYQSEFRQPLAQFALEPLGIFSPLESYDEVIGIAHGHNETLRFPPPPSLHPAV